MTICSIILHHDERTPAACARKLRRGEAEKRLSTSGIIAEVGSLIEIIKKGEKRQDGNVEEGSVEEEELLSENERSGCEEG